MLRGTTKGMTLSRVRLSTVPEILVHRDERVRRTLDRLVQSRVLEEPFIVKESQIRRRFPFGDLVLDNVVDFTWGHHGGFMELIAEVYSQRPA
jgi:hypothetical protein